MAIFYSNKKAAMEMSIGTIVTIVLLVTVLVLGLVLVRTVFSTGTDAVDEIDAAIQDEINKLFSDEARNLVVYPSSRDIEIEKGQEPAGFAFSVKNEDGVNSQEYTYTVASQGLPSAQCGGLTAAQADGYIIGATGSFSVSGGNSLQNARLVRFDVPETAPSCSFFYNLDITGSEGQEETAQIFVTFE